MSDPYSSALSTLPKLGAASSAPSDDPYSAALESLPLRGAVEAAPAAQQGDPNDPYSTENLPTIPGYNAAYPNVETGPSAADYAKSLLLKGPASGAKGVISSTLEGAGAIQATPISKPTERQLRASRSGDIDEVARAEQVAQSQQRLPSSVVDQPLYKAGAALDKWGSDVLKPAKGTEFLFDVGSGFGSVGAAIGMSLLSPMGAGLAFVASGAGEAAERAVKAGATPEQIGRASRMGTVAGATDVVDGLLPFMGTPGKIAGLIGKLGAKVVAGAFAEGGQEAVQQLIQNAIEKGIYNPNRDYMHEVGYNALIGAIVGGAAKPVLDKFSGEGESVDSPPVSKEDMDAVFGGPHEPGPEPVAPTELPTDLSTDPLKITVNPIAPGPQTMLGPEEDLSGGLDGEYAGVSGATDFSAVSKGGVKAAPAVEAPEPTAQEEVDAALSKPGPTEIAPPAPSLEQEPFVFPDDQVAAPQSDAPIFPMSDSAWDNLLKGAGIDPAAVEGQTPTEAPVEAPQPPPKPPTKVEEDKETAVAVANNQVPPKVVRFLNKQMGLSKPVELLPPGTTDVVEPEPEAKPVDAAYERAKKFLANSNVTSPIALSVGMKIPKEQAQAILDDLEKEGIVKGQPSSALYTVVKEKPAKKKGSKKAIKEEGNLSQDLESVLANAKMEKKHIVKVMGPLLYGDISLLPAITIKELAQNSHDNIKPLLEKKTERDGHITIEVDSVKRTMRIVDDGTGMHSSVLGKEFLSVGGSLKETARAGGGFGVAKMAFLYGNGKIRVITLRDGIVSELNTTGVELMELAIEESGQQPTITRRTPTEADKKLFPRGHGTAIEVTVPETYENSQGEVKKIDFPDDVNDTALKHSPLLDPIEVRYNGKVLDGAKGKYSWEDMPAIGKHFPLDTFAPFPPVDFTWGRVRIYISKEKKQWESYNSNTHVLSNGIWQFNFKLTDVSGAKPLDREIYMDVSPKYRPGKGPYPFDLNRQGFTGIARDDFAKISGYISAIYNYDDIAADAESFQMGDVHYTTIDPKTGKASKSKTLVLKPTIPPKATAADKVRGATNLSVEDGILKVDGKEVPAITPEELKNTPKTSQLKVDSTNLSRKDPMIHDNVNVIISDLEKKSMIQFGEEKFGERFTQYVHNIGAMFIELRDAVADIGPKISETTQKLKEQKLDYSRLKKVIAGISFDISYRGVYTQVPLEGMFLNLAAPEYTDPLRAAVGMVGTMVHEISHFREKNHAAEFPAEMQRTNINLEVYDLMADELNDQIHNGLAVHPKFDFLAFKQRMVEEVYKNADIHQFINGIFTGAFRIEARGKRFQDAGTQQVRDGGVSQPGAQAVGSTDLTLQQRVSQQLSGGEADAREGAGRGEFSHRVEESGDVDTQRVETEKNKAALQSIDPQMTVPPAQVENLPMKQAVNKIFQPQGVLGGQPPTIPPTTSGSSAATPLPVQQALVMVDKMNWMYKFAYGLERLVDRNPRFEPLRRYAELVRQMFRDSTKIQDFAVRVAKDWRRLPIKQQEGLAALIDDVTNMVYRTPTEIQAGTARHPTRQEFEKLVKQHGLAANGLRVYAAQREFFDKFLEMTVRNAFDEANRVITDPVARQDKIDLINNRWKRLQSRPYFPFLRFGSHFITVKDDTKQTVYFQTYERRGIRSAESLQMAAKKDMLEKIAKNPAYKGYTVDHGTLPENAAPFIGLPPDLLEAVQDSLHMTGQQKDAMEQLRYDLSPAASFAHRFQHKNYVKGYSDDFLRAFSRYAFHGARYYGRTKYAWALRAELGKADKYSKTLNDNKAGAVSSYMNDHFYNNILDSTGDFGLLKGAIFLWTFGYSVAGATLNLSQVPIITYPWMAAKFGGAGIGDARAVKALARAATQVSNFYRKGSYSSKHTDFHMRALDYGIRTGRISESQASDLAGLAQSNSLLGIGNNKARRGMQQFVEKGAWFFETAEQVNRRITYRAALELAQAHPNSIAVKEAMAKYADEYAKLSAEFNPSDARAIITAVHATEQTQFVYSKTNRPRLMRNRWANAILVFHNYMLNVLQLVGQDKSSVLPRYIIMMLAAGGLMGLPGADDLEDIVNIVGKQFFGKDFKLSHWLREMLNDMVGDKSDVVLHGLARRGFGVPALLDLIGEHPGRGLSRQPGQNVPAPVLDRSKAVGMGRLLPVELGKLVDPGKDVDKTVSEQIQRGSGAIFGIGFNLYKMMQDNSTGLGDPKRWEKVMPRELASLSRAFRAFTEGRERSKGGPNSAATVVPYDVRDTEQMAEIIAMAAGYTPLRVSEKWDQIMADAEVKAKLKFEEDIILKNLHEAMRSENPKEIDNAKQSIKDYNNSLPQWAKGYTITGETAYSSMEQRERQRISKEAGIPLQRRDVPVSRHIQELFPAAIDVRKVN